MPPRSLAGLLAAAGLASAAGAQTTPYSTATFQVVYLGDRGGNNNGIIEPGESALLGIDVDWTGLNTTATFSPPYAGYSSGTIRGHAGGYVDLVGTGGRTDGLWDSDPNGSNAYGVQNGAFIVTGGNGTPSGNDLIDIQWAQIPDNTLGMVHSASFHEMWLGLWTPASYEPRTVGFNLRGAGAAGPYIASVLIRIPPGQAYTRAYMPTSSTTLLGIGGIQIVPAPSTLSFLALFGVLARRRRT